MLLWNNWEHSSYEGREQGQADCRAAFPSQWSLDKQCSPSAGEGSVPKLKITQLLLISEAQKCTKPSPYQVFYHQF